MSIWNILKCCDKLQLSFIDDECVESKVSCSKGLVLLL